MMNDAPATPIIGPGIEWAITQINRHFERQIAKVGFAPVESVELERGVVIDAPSVPKPSEVL